MKRRTFFGFMGGAAVAGPSMAKQAVTASLSDLGVGLSNPFGPSVPPSGGYEVAQSGGEVEYATRRLGIFRRLVGSREWLARRKREFQPYALDPDLARYRSFSLAAKIHIQRERDFKRWLDREANWLERRIAGEEDY